MTESVSWGCLRLLLTDPMSMQGKERNQAVSADTNPLADSASSTTETARNQIKEAFAIM